MYREGSERQKKRKFSINLKHKKSYVRGRWRGWGRPPPESTSVNYDSLNISKEFTRQVLWFYIQDEKPREDQERKIDDQERKLREEKERKLYERR